MYDPDQPLSENPPAKWKHRRIDDFIKLSALLTALKSAKITTLYELAQTTPKALLAYAGNNDKAVLELEHVITYVAQELQHIAARDFKNAQLMQVPRELILNLVMVALQNPSLIGHGRTDPEIVSRYVVDLAEDIAAEMYARRAARIMERNP